ncbi:hypothetical protein SESBI_01479 [Sesbania bispinosa]|nr:hypothetical protein SESBI_01479 [Sesbania bispinosa]
MLSIKSGPTVVFQSIKRGGRGGLLALSEVVGRELPQSCCIQDAKLPLYAFKRAEKVDGKDSATDCMQGAPFGPFWTRSFLGAERGVATSRRDQLSSDVDKVSPIEYGHVLLIPRIFECLPQRIDHASFLLALHMAAEAGNPYFRVGYNSLGAFATIKPSSLSVRGLVFEGGHTLDDLANIVSEACICLQHNNIPFNVLISDCGRQIFLLPQCYAEKQALGERKKDYDEASEANAWRLLAEVSLSEERFQEVNALIFQAIASVEMDVKSQCIEEVDAVSSSTQPAMVAGSQECLVLQ